MSRRLRTLLPAAAAFASVAFTASAAFAGPVGDPAPIGPNQLFTALVNGKPFNATITVACPFPPTTGEVASPLPGQYVEVVPEVASAAPFGFTGSAADSIAAVFGPASVTGQAVLIHDYFVKVPIPTTVKVPCSGSGVVSFDPVPGSSTARSVTVSVTYANVAG